MDHEVFELGDIYLRLPHDLLNETVRLSEAQAWTSHSRKGRGSGHPGTGEDCSESRLGFGGSYNMVKMTKNQPVLR